MLAETRKDAYEPSLKDTGCWASPTCLDCDVPRCVLDDNISGNYGAAANRWRVIYDAYKRGMSMDEVCERYRISTRQFYRIRAARGIMATHPLAKGDWDTELPETDPCDLKTHNFKLSKPFSVVPGKIYLHACPRCGGDVAYTFTDMNCLRCGIDADAMKKLREVQR